MKVHEVKARVGVSGLGNRALVDAEDIGKGGAEHVVVANRDPSEGVGEGKLLGLIKFCDRGDVTTVRQHCRRMSKL